MLKDFSRECELTFESLLRKLTGRGEEPAIWSCECYVHNVGAELKDGGFISACTYLYVQSLQHK